jgi:hypothetical protein
MENLTASYMSGVKSGMVGHPESDATGEKDFNSAAGPVKYCICMNGAAWLGEICLNGLVLADDICHSKSFFPKG